MGNNTYFNVRPFRIILSKNIFLQMNQSQVKYGLSLNRSWHYTM